MTPIRVRAALPSDAAEMAVLFFETVHTVNRRDYSPEQIDAWAPRALTAEEWIARQRGKAASVAIEADRVAGFAELDPDGHIDCFYTRKDRQSRGIGSLLLAEVERHALAQGIPILFADVSLTARPFFEHRGFRVVREQQVVRRGVALTNFGMEKALSLPGP
jgi:putative acetyltransferase